jgi:hypothetical protein
LKRLLATAPWVLFGVFVVFPAIAGAAVTAAAKSGYFDRAVSGMLLGMALVAWFIAFFGWLWCLGTVANRSLGPQQRLSAGLFDVASGYVVAFGVLLVGSFFWPGAPIQALPMVLVLALHLLAIAASTVVIGFVSRSIVVCRYGAWRKGPWLLTFLLLWAYPVGIWFVQPWAQKIAAGGYRTTAA